MGFLVVVQGPWKGVELALTPGEHVLGRDPECDLAIPDTALSRRHVRFFSDGDAWRVEDLGSRNGTSVNDTRVLAAALLAAGDLIVAGRTTLRFEEGAPAALTAEPGSSTTVLAMASADEPSSPGEHGPRLDALLALGDALAAASGLEALGERVARWLLAECGGADAVLHRRRGSRLLPVAGYTLVGEAPVRQVALSPQAMKDVLDEGRTLLVERGGARDVVVPLGAPAELVVLVGSAGRPRAAELRFWAMAGRLAAGFLAGQLRVEALASRDPGSGVAAGTTDEAAFVPIASGPAMRPVIDFIDRVAASEVTVLLHGESGSGKDVVARAIHARSPRAREPFVAINCAALPESLVEAELFGHEKGAFTGALARRIGHFEAAHRGTLFLDEVAELSPGAQARLLRVLEDRQVQRLGATTSVAVDVRVVAATHQDLKQAVAERRFRQDLYFRLAVLVQVIPPLRERREDIEPLARRFLDRLRGRAGRVVDDFSARALEALRRHAWPGNVRELRNAVERAVILGRGPTIEPEDLPLDVQGAPELPPAAGVGAPDTVVLPAPLAEVERRAVLAALRATSGNKTQAARLLGVDRVTLYARLKAYGVGGGGDDPAG